MKCSHRRLLSSMACAIAFVLTTQAAHAITFTSVHSFVTAEGTNPWQGVIQLADGTLVGTCNKGGNLGTGGAGAGYGGTIFKVQPDGTGYTVVHAFNGVNSSGSANVGGSSPQTKPLFYTTDGYLYGVTRQGGSIGYGVLYKVKPDTTGYTVLKEFDYDQANSPEYTSAGIVLGADGYFYGAGGDGGGTASILYKITAAGTGITGVHKFESSATDGGTVGDPLLSASDGKIYGITSIYSSAPATVFRVNNDGTGFQVLHTFATGEGDYNYCGLTQGTDGTLYGQSVSSTGVTKIFKLSPDGSNFSVLHTLTTAEGTYADYSLLLASDGKLYGAAVGGGANSKGTIFSLNTDGSSFAVVHDFTGTGTDHGNPNGSLIQGQDGRIYGTTSDIDETYAYVGSGGVFAITVAAPVPTVTGISPSAAPTSGGTSVTITGTNFTGATAVTFGATPATSFTVNSATSITATSPAGTGTVDVKVTTTGGTSATSASDQFTYVAPPTVTLLSPQRGPVAGGTSVTITGTNFTGATAVTIGGAAATGVTVVSPTSITCTTPARTAGTASVLVTTPGGQNAANSLYTYVDPPTITNSTPIVVSAAGGSLVTLTGTNFTFTQSVTIGGATVPSISIPNNHTITFNAPAGTPGTYDVVVTTSGGSATSLGLFTYAGVPTVTAISPTAGPVDGGAPVTITGTNFIAPASVKIGGSSATSVVVVNSTTITCLTPSGGPGSPQSVVVTTPGGSNAANALYRYANPPYINYTGPKSGPTAGGTSVTIDGGNFTGTTSVTFNGVAATLGTVGDSSITCTTPAGTAGTIAIVVTAPGGTTTPDIISQFTYVAPPTVTSISPTSGPAIGGTSVTITGTNFTGATAVTFGATAATTFAVNSATKITATAPAGTGTVDVRVTTVGGTSSTSAADQFSYLSATQAVASAALTQNKAVTAFTPVTGSGGTGSLTYSVSPALPAGLSLSTSTGAITGTPSATATTTTYTVTVKDTNNATTSNTFTLTVNSAVTATQAIASKGLTQNQPFASFTPVSGGGGTGTLTYSVSPALPAGLSLSTSTGAITGSPSFTSSATTYTVTVTDSNSATATNTLSLTVNGAVTATQAIASKTLTQNQPSASFTPVTGGGGTATLSYSVSPALPAGLSLSTSTGAITGSPSGTSVATTYTVTTTDSNSATASNTFSLTINGAVTATQAIAAKTLTQNQPSASFTPVTGGGGTGTLSYSVSPALPAGLSLSTSTGVITGSPSGTSAATTYTVTVTDGNSATASNTLSLTISSAVTATQAVASIALTQNHAATSFTPVTGGGGTSPLAYSISPLLPTGLSLSTSTGAITGTPAASSSATTYTVTVTDSNNATASNTFALTVNIAVTATQAIASKALTQNQPSASFTPVTGGGGTSPRSYSVSPALPAGLSLSTSTGAVTGSPTGTLSATSYTVTVTDNNSATASAAFTLSISTAVTATQALASTTLAQNQAATSFTPVTGSAGTSPLSYSISPSLPTGLSISSSTGAITGTPAVSSSATTYTVTVTDNNSATASNTFSLTINPGVGIVATTATAVEGGATGLYTFTRGGSSGDLTVGFQMDASSTATAGTDFTLSSSQTFTFNTGTGAGTVVIPDGSATATLTLTALVENPNPAEAAETVRLNLVAGSGYAVNVPPGDNATVTIAANSFFVTITGDSGTGSLRQAVLNANTLGGTPTVTFSDGSGGTVNFTDATPDTITLTSGQLAVSASLVLAGPGADKLTIDGSNNRILSIGSISSYVISGVTFANGNGGGGGGGAILCEPVGGTLSGLVLNCSFSQNRTTSEGAAIFNYGLVGASATMDVIGCSFVQNSAGSGGAVSNHGGGGAGGGTAVLRVTNCTFSQNSANYGGSVYNWGNSGIASATILNCTFAGGSSANDGTDLRVDQNSTMQVGNCILASSGVATATLGGGSLVSLGHNITAGSAGPDDHSTDLLSTDPKIGTLASNGGTVLTLALISGSPAINAGSNALLPADTYDLNGNSSTAEAIPFDQRGTGFPRIHGATVDIGAFEALLYTPALTATTTNEDAQSSSGLVITANTADAGGTTNYQITAITGGALYKNDGSTAVANNDFITKAEGAAGLKFTPSADLFSPTTTFGFSVQASVSADGSGLKDSVVPASITVNPVADTPSVTNSATTMNIQTISGLVLTRNAVDGAEVAFFKITNIQQGALYQNDGSTAINAGDFITVAQGGAGLKFTPALGYVGVASFDVQGSVDNAGTGLSISAATATIAVGTVDPTPAQVVPTDPVTGLPLPLGSPYPMIGQTGLLEVRANIKNTTAFPINGFRLSVDYSAYLGAQPSLRLYNSSSAPGVVPAYIDYPYPVAVGETVSVKLEFYTSTRTLPNPFSPTLTVTKLAASEVSSTDGSGVQPRITVRTGGTVLLEWDSTPGQWYRIKYSADLTNWYDSTVPVQAVANRTQWIDDGAPFTNVSPATVPARFYRVIEIVAP